MYLYLLTELVTSGFKTVFIFLLSLVSIFFAIMTVIAKNPVVSVLFLIGLFFSIALYLMMLGLYFLGLSYLLVYVGAISILFLFILMLINVRVSELLTEGINSAALAVIAVVTFNFNVGSVLPYYLHISDAFSNYLIYINRAILNLFYTKTDVFINKLALLKTAIVETANVNSKSWDGSLVETNHISSIGNILYSNLFVLLIIISLVLLLAMVGTIVITLKRETNLKQINLESNFWPSLTEFLEQTMDVMSVEYFEDFVLVLEIEYALEMTSWGVDADLLEADLLANGIDVYASESDVLSTDSSDYDNDNDSDSGYHSESDSSE